MLRAVYVDDEPYNHIILNELIKQRNDIELIQIFCNGYEAIENCRELKPDIAFIDVEMPGISGLELATRLQAEIGFVDVVFVTAFSQYAIEAFRVNAVDYLLKPVDRAELYRVIEKVKARRRETLQGIENRNEPCLITLGKMGIWRDGVYTDFVWTTNKVKELFSYLLLKGEIFVDKWVLCELLWPEAQYEKVTANLYTTIYRLKTVLKSVDIPVMVVSANGRYKLDLCHCKVDFLLFTERVNRLLQKEEKRQIEELEQAAELYGGSLFGEEGYIWAVEVTEDLKNQYLQLLYKIAEMYRETGSLKAVGAYKRIVASFPYEERAVCEIISIYGQSRKYKELEDFYAYYKALLKKELDEAPSLVVLKEFNEAMGSGDIKDRSK